MNYKDLTFSTEHSNGMFATGFEYNYSITILDYKSQLFVAAIFPEDWDYEHRKCIGKFNSAQEAIDCCNDHNRSYVHETNTKILEWIKSKPHCQCLYEMENNLPPTKYCFCACPEQSEILKKRKEDLTKGELRMTETEIKTAITNKLLQVYECDINSITLLSKKDQKKYLEKYKKSTEAMSIDVLLEELVHHSKELGITQERKNHIY